MLKSCSRCGGIHPSGYRCNHNRPKVNEKKLRSKNAWTSKSLEIRERANYLCEVCRAKGRYVYEGLEVHHIEKIRDNPERLLDNYNLVCLCQECHRKAESGEIEAGYLRELAIKREDA